MQAIETSGRINEQGQLILSTPIAPVNQLVKVIVLFDESDVPSDQSWLRAMSSNPAFSFLSEPEEEIYTLADGKPFEHNEK